MFSVTLEKSCNIDQSIYPYKVAAFQLFTNETLD